ncbi:MAG: quinone-dependent dihydroorotate dehydrogenase [Bacteroidia bacterium]|nr:quinone-dependent dihydroorotate dehydrogenase [Bacteroidia bacterium]
MYKQLVRPLLFLFPAETAHRLTFALVKIFLSNAVSLGIIKTIFSSNTESLKKNLMGIEFPNPVGLAAGFDKDAEVYKTMSAFGFGFIEIGTVTPVPQAGNPKPRMFRLPADKSIVNRMGFNNHGAYMAVQKLRRNNSVIIGGNIGKNKVTPNENAIDDYTICFEELFDVVNYFVVNVSSPNTPGLRELQDKGALLSLLQELQTLNNAKPNPKPILLKIAPDLTNEQLDDIVEVCTESKLSGIIATNTTISREGLKTSVNRIEEIGAGGLSGASVTERSTEVIKYIRKRVPQDFVIIGVGGIMNAEDALDKIKAGADLIQLYSGLIYEGPSLVKDINKKLASYYQSIS